MKFDKSKINMIICAFFGVTLTWFLNHEMGYGAIVANGLMGVLAAILLPAPLAAVTYSSSFVGMSSTAIIPSLLAASVGGVIMGIIWVTTSEVYAGIGGKGGTTAALTALITKTIMGFFG